MKEYREEHQEKDKKLYVFIWVRLNLRFAGETARVKAFGPNPEHIIWKKATAGLIIDPTATDPGAAYNSMDLTVYQLEPEVRRPEAEAWIDTPAGIRWRAGAPVQLLQVSIDGH